jgi:mannose-6-phosphate isomerase-like protein (cupin superfamily)
VTDLLHAGQGEVLKEEPEQLTQVKADHEELALVQFRYGEGRTGPPLHFHREHYDCFYVLEGRLVFQVEDDEVEVAAGGFVAIPPLVVHTFRNDGPGDARFLNIHAPGKNFVPHLRDGAPFDSFDPAER